MKTKNVIIIPSRLESSRLPNKALIKIAGLPMIVHVFKRCELSKKVSKVYVATDSKKIADIVHQYGGKIIMTSKKHKTGTDRIAEASKHIKADVIINVQGDEVLVNPNHIDSLCELMEKNPTINVSILVNDYSIQKNYSAIKTVLNENNEVLYFSRNDIPSNHRDFNAKMLKAYHIIPFRKNFLIQYSKWKPTKLEKIEFNEYLRILEKGYKIKSLKVKSNAISVDTKKDLLEASKLFKQDKFLKYYK